LTPTLPFQLKEGMAWVVDHVNGQRLNGILDSDSDETLLDSGTAERLGLQKQIVQSKPISGGAEKTRPDSISFDLGPSALVASRPKIVLIGNQFPGMDFILGFDALGKTPFTVDYSKNMIRLGTVPSGSQSSFSERKRRPRYRNQVLGRQCQWCCRYRRSSRIGSSICLGQIEISFNPIPAGRRTERSRTEIRSPPVPTE